MDHSRKSILVSTLRPINVLFFYRNAFQTMKLHRMTSGLTFILGSSEFLDGQITERWSEMGASKALGGSASESRSVSVRLKPFATLESGGPPWVTGAAATGSDGCDMLECHGSSGSR